MTDPSWAIPGAAARVAVSGATDDDRRRPRPAVRAGQRPDVASVPFYLVSLMAVSVTWNGLRVGSNAIVDFFMLAAAVAGVTHLLAGRRSVPIPWWLLLAGLAIGVAALLSTIFPPDPSLVKNPLADQLLAAGNFAGFASSRSGASSALKFEIGMVVVPLLVAAVATTPARCRRLADMWALSCLISGTVAVTDLLHITHISTVLAGQEARQSGLTVQPNHLALTCAMALPIVTLWFGRGGRWRIASLVGGAVLLGAVYASGSRAGTAAAIVGVLGTVLLVPRLRRGLPAVLPVVGIAVLVVLLFSTAPRQIAEKVRLSGNATTIAISDSERAFAAKLAFRDVVARPLEGVGFGVIDDAHDIYLQVFAAGGLITFLGFLVYVFNTGLIAVRLSSRADGDLPRALGAVLLVWLLNGLVGTQVTDRYIYLPIGVLLSLSMLDRAGAGRAPG